MELVRRLHMPYLSLKKLILQKIAFKV
jgi:hypothetical protein